MWWHALTLAALSVLATPLAAKHEYLLPTDLKPLHYDLKAIYTITPTTNFSWYAVVDILFAVQQPTSKIVLHAQDFTIKESTIKVDGPDSPKVKNFNINDTFNLLTINLDKELKKGNNYTLTIPFFGNLLNSLEGVYYSSYVDQTSKDTEYLIVTQFEALAARKGFPCFDEPMYKATFKISLGHHKDYNAVSNMPQKNSTEENLIEKFYPWKTIEKTFNAPQSQFIWDSFDTSVPMSTYLMAFVISKFQYAESPQGLSSTKFRIWARKDAIDQTSYAATIGPKALSYYEKFFNIPFPLPKQDMFAIPDFSAGAMENWGLITYRETALLYDREQSSFFNKERVAEVISHELAHQWFGNLVTMKWWSDLWLNEGFATFCAAMAVNELEPTWNAAADDAVDAIQSILALDALESTRPVSQEVEDPKRISEFFDEISYRKGSILIRMMIMFLGEDVFRKALHNYLQKYSYSNAEQDDLWAELTATSQEHGVLKNITVKQVMDTWTKQPGYPLLTVERDYNDNTLDLMQKRYLNLGNKSTTNASWWVPLTVMSESEADKRPQPVQWLADSQGVTDKHRFEHAAKSNEWVIFNYDMIAPYRINYDKRNWGLLSDALNSDQYNKIPELGRIRLLSDAFALAWSEQLDYSIALQIANYLRRETAYLPLRNALGSLGKIDGILKRTGEYGAFQKFMRQLIGEQYHQSGGLSKKRIVNPDDLTSVKMQVMLSSWACRVKVPGCEENAIELFQTWMDEPDPDAVNPIPLDLRKMVSCIALRRGSVREWRFMLERKQKANVAAVRDTALSALTCTNEVWILTQYLEWCITENSEVRKQDSARIIANIISSSNGYYVAKEFIYNRIKDIYKANQGQTRRVGMIVKSMLHQFTTQRELDEFLAWREKNKEYLEDAKIAVSQGIESAKVNIAWLNRNRLSVAEKFREFTVEAPAEKTKRELPHPKDLYPGLWHSILSIHNVAGRIRNWPEGQY